MARKFENAAVSKSKWNVARVNSPKSPNLLVIASAIISQKRWYVSVDLSGSSPKIKGKHSPTILHIFWWYFKKFQKINRIYIEWTIIKRTTFVKSMYCIKLLEQCWLKFEVSITNHMFWKPENRKRFIGCANYQRVGALMAWQWTKFFAYDYEIIFQFN